MGHAGDSRAISLMSTPHQRVENPLPTSTMLAAESAQYAVSTRQDSNQPFSESIGLHHHWIQGKRSHSAR